MSVPFFSLAEVNHFPDLSAAIHRVVASQKYILSDEVERFEKEFSQYCGVDSCVAVGNGTDALELSLLALGVAPGDCVALTANVGFYGSTAVRAIRATPRYVDIDPISLTMCPTMLEQELSRIPNVKAVIVTHTYGQLADMEAILAVTSQFNIPIIEDCAHAHGAERNRRRAGNFGTIGCFSFYPTKNLGAIGDGGAIVTHKALATDIRKLRQYGWNSKYDVVSQGGRNSRMDEIQAAVLRERLPFLDLWNAQRREVASQYHAAFAAHSFRLPCSLDKDFVAHLYVIRESKRSDFQAFLKGKGVATEIHYPIPDHLQSAYVCEQKLGSLPETEKACQSVVSLPCFPGMTQKQIEQVIHAVIEFSEML